MADEPLDEAPVEPAAPEAAPEAAAPAIPAEPATPQRPPGDPPPWADVAETLQRQYPTLHPDVIRSEYDRARNAGIARRQLEPIVRTAGVPPAWEDVADRMRAAYPDVPAEDIQREYTQARQMREARLRVSESEESPGHYLMTRAAPFYSSVVNAKNEAFYHQSLERLQNGHATAEDADRIATFERLREIDANRGPFEQAGSQLMRIPAMVGEAVAGGTIARGLGGLAMRVPGVPQAIGAAGRLIGAGAAGTAAPSAGQMAGAAARGTAQFLGETAVQTAVMPSMYLDQAVQNNVEVRSTAQNVLNARQSLPNMSPSDPDYARYQELARDPRSQADLRQAARRDPMSPEGLPSAFALGMVQTAILGTIGRQVGSATRNATLLSGTRAAEDSLRAQATRVGAGAVIGVIEQQAGDAVGYLTGLQTHYGLADQIYHGQRGEAAQHAAIQALTFAAFAGLHEVQSRRDVIRTYQDAMNDAHERGLSIGEASREVGNQFEEIMRQIHDVPDLTREQARKAAETLPDGPEKELARKLADLVPDHLPPTGPEPGIDRPAAPSEPSRAETAPSAAGTPPEVRAGQPRFIDMRSEIAKDKGRADLTGERIKAEVQKHLDSGGKVSLWFDGKEVSIVSTEGGMLRDAKGQPWGTTALAMGSTGKKTGLELHPSAPSAQAQAPGAGSAIPRPENAWHNTGTKFAETPEGLNFHGRNGEQYQIRDEFIKPGERPSSPNGGVIVRVFDKAGEEVGHVGFFRTEKPGIWQGEGLHVEKGLRDTKERRTGISAAMYDYIAHQGEHVVPAGGQTGEGKRFWERNREFGRQQAEKTGTVPPQGTVEGKPAEKPDNPYLRMPLERVKKDAQAGVSLAKEALQQRQAQEPAAERPGGPYADTPHMRKMMQEADSIRSTLPAVEEGQTRLWRGEKGNAKLGEATRYTDSLEGIALPFAKGYEGKLAYVDVPTKDLPKYVNDMEPNAWNLPKSLTANSRQAADFGKAPQSLADRVREQVRARQGEAPETQGRQAGSSQILKARELLGWAGAEAAEIREKNARSMPEIPPGAAAPVRGPLEGPNAWKERVLTDRINKFSKAIMEKLEPTPANIDAITEVLTDLHRITSARGMDVHDVIKHRMPDVFKSLGAETIKELISTAREVSDARKEVIAERIKQERLSSSGGEALPGATEVSASALEGQRGTPTATGQGEGIPEVRRPVSETNIPADPSAPSGGNQAGGGLLTPQNREVLQFLQENGLIQAGVIERLASGQHTPADLEAVQQMVRRLQGGAELMRQDADASIQEEVKNGSRSGQLIPKTPEETAAVRQAILDAANEIEGNRPGGGPGQAGETPNRASPGAETTPAENVRGTAAQPDLATVAEQRTGRPISDAERSGVLPGGGQSDAGSGREQRVTALANEKVDTERKQRGLPELMGPARLENREVWDRAMAKLDADPKASETLIEDLAKNPRATTIEENALLLHRRIVLANEHERVMLDYIRGQTQGADVITMNGLESRERQILGEIDLLDRVIRKAGTEWGRAGQFRRQLATENFGLSSMLNQARAAKGRELTPEEKAEIVKLNQKIAELQKKLEAAEARRQETGGGVGSEEFAEEEAARIGFNDATNEFKTKLKGDRDANRTWPQKMEDLIVKWRRASVISSPTTMLKIIAASAQRIAFTPGEEAIGAALSRIPGLSKIAAVAPREGRGFNPRIEKQAFMDSFTKGMKDAWDYVKKGHSELDTLYGDTTTPRSWLDFIGELHAAGKAPAVRAEYTRSFLQRVDFEAAQGHDVTSPAALMRIGVEAYKDSQRAKFQQDNRVVDAWKAAMNKLTAPDASIGARVLGTAGKLAVPVVRIPTNLVAEAFQYAFGTVTGGTRAAIALAKGVKELKPEEADHIMRSLKKGSVGLAALALGYFNPSVIGGFYSGRREESDVEAGGIRTPAGTVPSWLLHNPLLEVLQLGATIRRAQDQWKRGEQGGLAKGIGTGILGLAEEVPFVREATEIGKLFDANRRGHFFGEFMKSLAVPQLFQWLAGRMDIDPMTGKPTRRRAEGVMQHIQTGIPGARNAVPAAGR